MQQKPFHTLVNNTPNWKIKYKIISYLIVWVPILSFYRSLSLKKTKIMHRSKAATFGTGYKIPKGGLYWISYG